jgi:aflatoxin B1 aldehyde reductase
LLYTADETTLKFGLSNFTRGDVIACYNYAKSKNYILPTVYQSNYNLAARKNETLLFPTLRELGISIQAYSPIAGGFLAKTVEQIENGKGRWDPTTRSGLLYRALYYSPVYLKMLGEYDTLAKESGAGHAGLAYRWIRYHSALDGGLGDTVIIGASSAAQLDSALVELAKGPLEKSVADKINELWKIIEADAPIDNLDGFKKLGW